MTKAWIFIFSLITTNLMAQRKNDNNMLEILLKAHPDTFQKLLNHPQKNEIQILYTQINRNKNNKAQFKTYAYNLNNTHYFYPASTVKLPTAIFALEKLNKLNIDGLKKETTLLIDSAFGKQTKVNTDNSAINNLPSIENYIKKILLVSDNDAFNRIYEFTDRQEINAKLKKYGFNNSRIINRLSIGDSGEDTRHTNPISFYNGLDIIYKKPAAYDPTDYPIKLNHLLRGKGYIDNNDKLIVKPFDFTNKNVFQLNDQHELMKRLFFPNAFPKSKQFNLSTADFDFLYKYMSSYPRESDFPKYDPVVYYPAYCKFLFYGAQKDAIINPNIRIFNKVGDSYGYAIDNIYFIDYDKKVEFILTAVIQSNEDEIYNDNKYEYETVCFPFMKNLGQLIYDLEVKREKKYLPDFSTMLKYK